MEYKLKTLDCVNALIKDLYIDLRTKVNYWASLTGQTSQARMGYIGQHLVSAVTGYKGSKSGARGKDLIIDDDNYAEIKTCSKVDQLGCCHKCGFPISSFESKCPSCGSTEIDRKDDSKWLISIKSEYPEPNTPDSEGVLININKPRFYYFVLFEYEDISKTDSSIVITIYQVDPKAYGFSLCMLDYFYNIRSNAPFNMWPHMLKFSLCNPSIIYQSKVSIDGSIQTIHFCPDEPYYEPLVKLSYFGRAKNLRDAKVLKDIARQYDMPYDENLSYESIIALIDDYLSISKETRENNLEKMSKGFYEEPILNAKKKLEKEGKDFPKEIRKYVEYCLKDQDDE